MAVASATLLRELEALKNSYGGEAAAQKLALLVPLLRRRLITAAEVLRLHELLCFMQAYPDDAAVLEQVEAMLAAFARRGDLRRHRRELADTGIAGTDIYYSFYWPTARWIERRYPASLTIDWVDFSGQDRLSELLGVLMPASESPAFDMLSFAPRQWLDELKGAGENDETDAAFLIRRFAALKAEPRVREKLYEDLDVPMRLTPGPGTPARSGVKLPGQPVTFQIRPLSRKRPKLRQDILRPPLKVRQLSPHEGRKVIDLAVAAMITRARDLDAFAYGDPGDVRLIDCGDGLQFACIGQVPERRLMLESVYGFLTIKNGVPIGYVLASSLFHFAEIAYNVFETFRGAEAAPIFGRVLAMVHHLFGARAFSIDPYQLGHHNSEGLQSGAWWFYYKLGFRPEDPEVRRLLRGELQKLRANPRHRSSRATLQELSASHTYFYLDERRDDVLPKLSIGELGLKIARSLAERDGGDRERAIRAASRKVAGLLGVRSLRSWSQGERLAWARWCPVIQLLPGVARWSQADRSALVKVILAKGGRRESDFVRLFDQHRRLRRAMVKLLHEAD